MSDFFSPFVDEAGFGTTRLPVRFDAERDTPQLLDALSSHVPEVRDIMASLRRSVPLAPHSGPGAIGRFYRIPNHYRSLNFVVPSRGQDEAEPSTGVVVFKGTEPLLPDFPRYLEWMLGAPFRASTLPMALHFALEMKLPPAAMWIEECVMEQHITSRIQLEYFRHYGRLARLPMPLFVFELTREQVRGYEAALRSRVSAAAFTRIEAKIADGLGIEVYYYPSLPIRTADLFVDHVKKTFRGVLSVDALERVFLDWIELLYEMLHLGYMPYAPWNYGMGSCVDTGNACIDGGFNDLLTLVPFDSIPTELLFRRSLHATMESLSNSIASVCAVASNTRAESKVDSTGTHFAYVAERLRAHVKAEHCDGHALDARLKRFFEVPTVSDVIDHVRELQGNGQDRRQFVATPVEASAAEPRVVTV
jgi:hypothetical protein